MRDSSLGGVFRPALWRLCFGLPDSGRYDLPLGWLQCPLIDSGEAERHSRAFVFNATVVPPGLLGFITMWPQGQSQPLAATLNAVDGANTNNMAIVPTTTGSVSVFPSAPTHLVLDIFGFFAP